MGITFKFCRFQKPKNHFSPYWVDRRHRFAIQEIRADNDGVPHRDWRFLDSDHRQIGASLIIDDL
jgi:hypothetical protein